MRDPLDFVRANVRAESLCSDVVAAWISECGVPVGIGRVGQLRAWTQDGVLNGATKAAEQIGLSDIDPKLAQEGDVAVGVLPNGDHALGIMRAGKFLVAASGTVAIHSGEILKAWCVPCR